MWDGVSRRKFPRAEYPCLVTIRKNTQPQEAILTHTENISIGGVRIILAKKIGVLTEVDLELDLKDTLATIISKGTICWAQQISVKGARYRYDTGVKFLGLKDSDRRRIQKIVARLLDRTR
ncbi:PilZ domain-containing protein [Candidatus Omnitrophota bacterium]